MITCCALINVIKMQQHNLKIYGVPHVRLHLPPVETIPLSAPRPIQREEGSRDLPVSGRSLAMANRSMVASELERENETEAFEAPEVREAAEEFARVEEESQALVDKAVKKLELATEHAFKDQSDESFAAVTAAESELLKVMEHSKAAKREAAKKLSAAKTQAKKPPPGQESAASMAQNRPGPKRRPPSSKSRSQLLAGLQKDPSSLQVTLVSHKRRKSRSSGGGAGEEKKSKNPRTVDFHHMPTNILEVLEMHMSLQQQKQLEEHEKAASEAQVPPEVEGSFITRSVGRTLDESVV